MTTLNNEEREKRRKYQEDLRLKDPKKYYRDLQVRVYRWIENNPEKVKAHRKIFTEVRAGRIIPQKCFCGKKGEAHHEDYTKPLEVIWLCKKHHRQADRGELSY